MSERRPWSGRTPKAASSGDEDPFSLPMLSPKTREVLFAPTSTSRRRESDLSHIKDTKKSRASQIPPTMIPEQYHIRDESPAPPFDPALAAASTFDERTKVWRTTVFPSPMPSSRQEVILLEQWLDRMLRESQEQQLGPIEAVKRAQQLYAQSFHEILRQVYVTCAERGQLLDKIWSRYLQLFDHVLKIRDKERVQYNQKLQQQKLMYQQLYKDKDDAFNQVYLQLAAEKERIQMARDKLERAVLLMQDDIRKRVRKETRLKRVVHHLRMRAKEMNVEEEPDEPGYESDDSLLPPDLSPDSFTDSNKIVTEKLRYIEEKLQRVRKSVPADQQETNYGSMLELDSLLHSLADTISRLTTTEDTPALRMLQQQQPQTDASGEGGGVNMAAIPSSIARHSKGIPAKFHIDKSVQYTDSDLPALIPKCFNPFLSKTLRLLVPQEQEKSWALAHINALYMQKVVADEECDAREAPRVSLPEFAYGFFISLYGVRSLAEQAISDLMETCNIHAPSSLRIRMFQRFLAGELYSRDDFAFFLYTLAQFYERRDGDISFSEAADGSQWVALDTAHLAADVILRDQDADAREAVLADCERSAAGSNRIELDAFLEAMTQRAHTIGNGPEEQLSGLFNSALAVDSISSPSGALIYDDLAALVRGFSPNIGESEMHQIFRDVLDDLGGEPPSPANGGHSTSSTSVLFSIARVCRQHGLLGWKIFPPTSVDRKRCGELIFTLLAVSWAAISEYVARDITEIAQSGTPEAARTALLVQERMEDLQRHLEARENAKQAIVAFRTLNEQVWFARRHEKKFVQGRQEQASGAAMRSRN